MTKMNTYEFSNLRKSVNSYINKHPSADKNINKTRLKKLSELKPFIEEDTLKRKEYFEIRDSITLSNGGFAMKYVMRYLSLLNDDAAIGELFQEATIGIMESIDTFDINRKTSFTTYAYFHIRKRIIDFIKNNKLVKAPRDIARNMKHVNETQGYLFTTTGSEPTTIEIKKTLKKDKGIKLKEETIDNIVLLLDLNSAGYEEAFLSEYTDQIGDEEESDIFRLMELNVLSSISRFPVQVQKAIMLRYGIGREYPHSPEEVKLILNITDKDLIKLE